MKEQELKEKIEKLEQRIAYLEACQTTRTTYTWYPQWVYIPYPNYYQLAYLTGGTSHAAS